MRRSISAAEAAVGPRARAALLLLAGLAALAGLFLVDPATSALLPPCPVRAITGLVCPGCGTARALHRLLHGDFVAAFRLSPLLPAWAPLLGHAALSTLSLAARGRRLPEASVRASVIALLTGLIAAFWLVRNTALYPFES